MLRALRAALLADVASTCGQFIARLRNLSAIGMNPSSPRVDQSLIDPDFERRGGRMTRVATGRIR